MAYKTLVTLALGYVGSDCVSWHDLLSNFVSAAVGMFRQSECVCMCVTQLALGCSPALDLAAEHCVYGARSFISSSCYERYTTCLYSYHDLLLLPPVLLLYFVHPPTFMFPSLIFRVSPV